MTLQSWQKSLLGIAASARSQKDDQSRRGTKAAQGEHWVVRKHRPVPLETSLDLASANLDLCLKLF